MRNTLLVLGSSLLWSCGTVADPGSCPELISCAESFAPVEALAHVELYGDRGECWKNKQLSEASCRAACDDLLLAYAIENAVTSEDDRFCPIVGLLTESQWMGPVEISKSSCEDVAVQELFDITATAVLDGIDRITIAWSDPSGRARGRTSCPVSIDEECVAPIDDMFAVDGWSGRATLSVNASGKLLFDERWTRDESGCRYTIEGRLDPQ